jgi:predicted NAD/FAD-binding protein
VFERQPRPGFTAANVEVPGVVGPEARVDVPLRVFYPGYYPTLGALYRELGVASEPVDYAATLCGADGRPYFRYRNLAWGDRAVGVLAPRDLLLGRPAWQIVAGLWRWRRAAQADATSAGSAAGAASLGEYLDAAGFARAFVDGFLLPAVATVCTCTFEQARRMPAAVVLDYAARGVASQAVRRVCDGADEVQRRLVGRIGEVRCNARLEAVWRGVDGRVHLRHQDGHEASFDRVVFAAPAPAVRRMLVDARDDEAAVLRAFETTTVDVLTHQDERLMPVRRRDWSPVNLRVVPDRDTPEATIWINAVQRRLRTAPPVFQTVHPHREPRPGTVLGLSRFERPVVDARSAAALEGLERLHAQAGRQVWFCGSYAQSGVPLLESAVRSARRVVDAIERMAAPRGSGASPVAPVGAFGPSGPSGPSSPAASRSAASGVGAGSSTAGAPGERALNNA